MIRLHVPDPLRAGGEIELRPHHARYLAAVMRLKPGDGLLVFNGRDGEWRARLSEVSKRGGRLVADEQTRPQATGPDLDLLIALVKRARLEIIVEKAAELGARRVRPILTRRTNAERTNVARLQVIAIEASEQTGRLDAPEVLEPEPLARVLDNWTEERRLMFCDEAGGDPDAPWGGPAGRAPPALRALAPASAGPWAVLVGPEGGFAPEERDRLRAAPYTVPVSLGPRILRADTAAISALTLWQAAKGDWAETASAPKS